ncbi:MAG: hypothetical protein JOZ11_18630 [Alphaproteobacteria bacterium]|nr:hypothetical protein [Alphaproteobacteria bacterium]
MAVCAVPAHSDPLSFDRCEDNCPAAMHVHAWDQLNARARQLYAITFGEFDCGWRSVNLLAELFDDVAERKLVVFRVGSELTVEPIANGRADATRAIDDDFAIRGLGQKVLERDFELVNARQAGPLVGCEFSGEKICFQY